MSKRLLIHFALLLCWVVPTQAQLTLTLPELTASKGEQIEVDLTVKDYTNLFLCQFTIRWNPDVLRFKELSENALIDEPGLMINLNDSLDGFFRLISLHPSFTERSFDDDSALLKMKFEVTGEVGDTSILEISDDPTPFLVAGNGSTVPGPTFRNNGMVIVSITDGIYDPLVSGNATLYQNQPNPFQDKTVIQFDLAEPEYITFTLYDLLGKKILEQAQLYSAGSQFISLEQHQLPSAGTYLYQIQADNYLLTKKLNMVR